MKVTFEGGIHEILDQIEAFTKAIVDEWSKPVKVEQKPAKKVKVVQPEPEAIPEQKHEAAPEDLLTAVMTLVGGDKVKKDMLLGILAEYGSKTVRTLDPDQKDQFWADVKSAFEVNV